MKYWDNKLLNLVKCLFNNLEINLKSVKNRFYNNWILIIELNNGNFNRIIIDGIKCFVYWIFYKLNVI